MYKTGTAMERPTSFEHRWTGFLVREPVYADCGGSQSQSLALTLPLSPRTFCEQLFTNHAWGHSVPRWLNLFLLTCLLAGTAQARQVGGITFPEAVAVNGVSLALNGAGVRSKYFLDVYAVGLYLPEPSQNPAAIIRADETQRLRLVITSSHITRDRLTDSIEEGVRLSAGKDYPHYKPMLAELWAALTFEVRIGDVFEFTYVPRTGTTFTMNGKELRVLPDFQFKQVLFGIWLGDDPIQKSVKAALLSP